MEKTVKMQKITILLLVVILIFNFFSIADLKSRIENLESNISYRFENITKNINSIYNEIADINDETQAEASLVTSFEYDYGEFDSEKLTVPVKVKLVPKEVSDDTAFSIEFGGRTVELKRNESTTEFMAEFEVGAFEKNESGMVTLVKKSGGSTETQELEWYINDIRSAVIPYASAYFHFSDIKCSEKYGVSVDGTVSVIIDGESEDSIVNKKLIYKMNGEVLAEETVTGDDDFIQIYKVFSDYGIGDTFELYFEAEDGYGFIHETKLTSVTFTSYGEVDEEALEDLDETIKDKEGNILYP